MEVTRDDGIYRHVRFKRPGTSCMHFDLITWPGYHCYTGDMGTYVFSRIRDMFEFFRTDREHMRLKDGRTLAINPSYWSEKVEARDRCGVEEFSEDLFRDALKREFDSFFENREPDDDASEEEKAAFAEKKAEAWEAVEDEILGVDSLEHEGVGAACRFEHDGLEFADFWDHRLTDYTHRFMWCCFALAWGVQQYDTAKQNAVEQAA
jgi:hypothetical protein